MDNKAAENAQRPFRPMRKKKKVCLFCADKIDYIDYKDTARLKKLVSERSKILPRRISGTCAVHQRQLTVAVKRARQMALIPYVSDWAAFCSSAQAGWWTKSGVSLIMYAGPKGWKPNEFNGWQTSVSLNQRVRHFEKWRTRWLYFLFCFVTFYRFEQVSSNWSDL